MQVQLFPLYETREVEWPEGGSEEDFIEALGFGRSPLFHVGDIGSCGVSLAAFGSGAAPRTYLVVVEMGWGPSEYVQVGNFWGLTGFLERWTPIVRATMESERWEDARTAAG